ncbi:hypothetical protein LOTGIDRAFT_169314 [Lottia gigantea]|uniref:Glycosyltransferase family 92 protein n=1 Tax=Lottia gigantea TaxID=225164 RepID=V3YZ76_LOTGI|nr:hypothetical protein LOTGIDRAFT_169314 [Lottia gigantea]ESO83448.1 hypothetical protein LOTGIDRAFT_169314 [Lottia gigantea]
MTFEDEFSNNSCLVLSLQSSTSRKSTSSAEREVDLLVMTTIHDKYTDIDHLTNWTSLFTSDRVRLLFFLQYGDIKTWKTRFPDVEIIPLNSTIIMCNSPSFISLNVLFQTAKKMYRSHFYAYVNENVLVSNQLLVTLSDLINSYKDIESGKSTLLIARSRLVKDKNVALQLLQSNLHSSQIQYSMSGLSDVFITNRQFEWSNIPNMIAHQDSTSQLLLAISRRKRVVLLDVTKSSNVVRIRKKKTKPSRYVMRCEKNMVVESDIDSEILETCGSMKCVALETTSENSKVIIKQRHTASECSICNFHPEVNAPWLP